MMTSKEQVKKSWAVQKIDSIWSNVEWNVAKGKKNEIGFSAQLIWSVGKEL